MGGNLGYSNGFIPDSMLVTFKTGWNSGEGAWKHQLSPGTYAKHLALVELARKNTGGTVSITDGWGAYRPYDSQVYARSLYGLGAAYPGTSSHGGFWENQETLAIDYDWGGAYGWDRDAWFRDVRVVGLTPGLIHPSRGNGYPDEPWHVVDLAPWAPPPQITQILEDAMSNPIINVVPKYGVHFSNGTLYVGLDDGSFEPLRPPFATNIRGIIGKAFFGGDGDGNKDTIPTLSQADFNALKVVWATMCKGRTDAAAVWAEGVHAQDAEGRGLYLDDKGAITTEKTSRPLKFTAAGFLASTNALANDTAS